MNNHVAEPFRSIVDSMIDPIGVNLFELQVRSERLTIDIARKQMGTDVLRAMLAAKPNGAQAMVDAAIELVGAEAKK